MSDALAATDQQAAQGTEPSAPPAAPPPSAPVTPPARAELASFGDALTKAVRSDRAGKDGDRQREGRATEPTADGASTDEGDTSGVSKPSDGRGAAPQPTEDTADAGASTDEVLKAADAEAEADAEGAEKPEPAPKGGGISRRSAARELEALRAENETLKAKAVDVPPEVLGQLEQYRLSDDEFSRLETKLKREDLTGDVLTAAERERYNTALTVREWFAPVYAHARADAQKWAEDARQGIFRDQASELAPILRDRPYIKPDVIGAADTWGRIYAHIADASVEHGRGLERAELAPKLEEAQGRIADLEAEVAGLRPAHAARASRPLERGGLPSGGSAGRPNLRTARSAGELFEQAFKDSERHRTRRSA